jgi:hypothetical protein
VNFYWSSSLQTFHGIDTCGKRLAEEIRLVVAKYPSLKYISFLGHSMGGLLVRHAVGHLYNPSSMLVAGLQPIHFITMASPHLGCDASGESQARAATCNFGAAMHPATPCASPCAAVHCWVLDLRKVFSMSLLLLMFQRKEVHRRTQWQQNALEMLVALIA